MYSSMVKLHLKLEAMKHIWSMSWRKQAWRFSNTYSSKISYTQCAYLHSSFSFFFSFQCIFHNFLDHQVTEEIIVVNESYLDISDLLVIISYWNNYWFCACLNERYVWWLMREGMRYSGIVVFSSKMSIFPDWRSQTVPHILLVMLEQFQTGSAYDDPKINQCGILLEMDSVQFAGGNQRRRFNSVYTKAVYGNMYTQAFTSWSLLIANHKISGGRDLKGTSSPSPLLEQVPYSWLHTERWR